jgi:hypothetical protein
VQQAWELVQQRQVTQLAMQLDQRQQGLLQVQELEQVRQLQQDLPYHLLPIGDLQRCLVHYQLKRFQYRKSQ